MQRVEMVYAPLDPDRGQVLAAEPLIAVRVRIPARWRTTSSPPVASCGSRRTASAAGSRARSPSGSSRTTTDRRARSWCPRARCGAAWARNLLADPACRVEIGGPVLGRRRRAADAGRPRPRHPRADPALRDAGRGPGTRRCRSGFGRRATRRATRATTRPVRPVGPRVRAVTIAVQVETQIGRSPADVFAALDGGRALPGMADRVRHRPRRAARRWPAGRRHAAADRPVGGRPVDRARRHDHRPRARTPRSACAAAIRTA